MAATATRDVPRSGDQSVDGLLSGWRWNVLSLTYSFPTSGSFYEYGPERQTFSMFNSSQRLAAERAMDAISSFTPVIFTKTGESGTRHGDLRFAETNGTPTAHAFYPGVRRGGDAWFNKVDYNSPGTGTYAGHTVFHEIGHTMGLKHPHELERFGRTLSGRDSVEFSVMSYHSYVGSPINFLRYDVDSAPQSYMMLDIAALQHIYGADFSYRTRDDAYVFRPSSGDMFVNGVRAGSTAGNVIFRTIWDGGGSDTFDLRAFSEAQVIRLEPGKWSTFSKAQLADLGDGHSARANIFNALLYQNDTRSLIENVLAGKGNDSITGNQADNDLSGSGGNDILVGLSGNDTLRGGVGRDTMLGGVGNDELVGDQQNDVMYGGADTDRLDGGAGDDILEGGAGDDRLIGSIGNDTIYGGTKNSVLSGTEYIDGGAGDDRLYGSTGNDLILGGAGNDSLDGADGLDELIGGDGNDIVVGGLGNDRLFGDVDQASGLGNDRLSGGLGDDLIIGGGGDDLLTGDQGGDSIDGGIGQDTAIFGGVSGDYQIATVEAATTVTHIASGEIDGLTGVEFLQFSDVLIPI